MSRRLRKEQEYAQQLKQEAEEEDDKLKKQQQKIFDPVIWTRLTFGYRIQGLRENQFEEVVEMVKTQYVPKNVLCSNAELENDEVSMKSFVGRLMFLMKDTTSIVVLDERNEEELAGVLIMCVINKSNYDRIFHRVIYMEGEAAKKINDILNALIRKVDIFKLCNCDTFIHYHLVCIKDEHRKKNLGYHLMRAGLIVAHSLHIKVVSGIFTSYSLQHAASRLDFKLQQEVSYMNWRDKNNELIFSDPGAGNYTCALMVCEVPEVRPKDAYDFQEKTPAELRVVVPPRTRQEKRAKLNRGLNVEDIDQN